MWYAEGMPITGTEPNPPIPYDWPAWHVAEPAPERGRDWPLAFYILDQPRRLAEAIGDPVRLVANVVLLDGTVSLLTWKHAQVKKIAFPFFLRWRFPMKTVGVLSLPRVPSSEAPMPVHKPPTAEEAARQLREAEAAYGAGEVKS